MDPTVLSAGELARQIQRRHLSALDAVDSYLRQIDERNGSVNAVIRVAHDAARARAREADAALSRGESWGPLHGVPFTLKDMHGVANMAGSLGTINTERTADVDGVVAERLLRAGGILLGKTNMSNGVQTASEQFGRTSNPYDLARTPGGSSGGAAAAIASFMTAFDVGTDLSGSIRMPSHFCGIFGLRPTLHRVPLGGMIDGAPGNPRGDRLFSAAGPMARTAEDIALLFSILAGPDVRDPEVPPVPVRQVEKRELRGLRIAIAPSISGIRIAAEIRDAIANLGQRLAREGASVEERMPVAFDELLAAFRRCFRILLSIAVRAGVKPPTGDGGFSAPSPFEIMTILDERDKFIAKATQFFDEWDAFLCPAATLTAFPHCPRGTPVDIDGEATPSSCIDHPTLLSTYTGSPSFVIPIAQGAGGLPIGAQLVGARWNDENLVAIGAAIADMIGPLPSPTFS